jgi:hypothetical protein
MRRRKTCRGRNEHATPHMGIGIWCRRRQKIRSILVYGDTATQRISYRRIARSQCSGSQPPCICSTPLLRHLLCSCMCGLAVLARPVIPCFALQPRAPLDSLLPSLVLFRLLDNSTIRIRQHRPHTRSTTRFLSATSHNVFIQVSPEWHSLQQERC